MTVSEEIYARHDGSQQHLDDEHQDKSNWKALHVYWIRQTNGTNDTNIGGTCCDNRKFNVNNLQIKCVKHVLQQVGTNTNKKEQIE